MQQYDNLFPIMSEKVRKKKSQFINKLILWARKVDLESKAAYVLVLGLVLSSIAAYALFSNVTPLSPTPDNLYILVLLITILLLFLVTLVVRQIIKLWAINQKGAAATRLHKRIVTLFSVVAIAPTIIVASFSVMFFEFGLQSWFSEKVQTVLDSSESVAQTYLAEHIRIIRADALGMANALNRQAFALTQRPELLDQALNIQVRDLNLSEAIIINREGIITSRATSTFSTFDGRLNKQIIDAAAEGGVKFFPDRGDGQIRVLLKLEAFLDQYLYIGRLIDAQASALVRRTLEAKSDFEKSQAELTDYRLIFNVTFLVIALIVLFMAAWMGLGLANKLMKPINILVRATDRVGKGDFSARAPIKEGYDDLGGLTKAFNTMMWQLQKQQKDLLDANVQLDERSRFTETVLSGVSAGIMGLDAKGKITLPNRAAAFMLAQSMEELKGKNIKDVMPEVADLFEKIVKMRSKSVQDQVSLEREEVLLNLMVWITAEMKDTKVEGYVISFDDITEQVAAQRTAAWADVAQRIAHEIKNPLTPIQLSAERLKRKYLKEIHSEPEIFTQCTDTIIRQVGELRQMVDEFSSFARMPTPIMHSSDLGEIIKQAVFLMDVSKNNIKFSTQIPDKAVYVDCDASQIGQALTNIIKNATEALHKQKHPEINIVLLDNGSEARIIVTDNGKGMPESMIDRLTEPYVTTRSKGTGLGLAIVKKIMKDHNGDLILENNKHGGASSILVFLKATVKTEKQPEKNGSSENSANSNIRIVHGA